MQRTTGDRYMVFRALSAGAAALAGTLGLIGLVVSIQGDQLVSGTWLLVVLGVTMLVAFGSAVLVIYRPLMASFAMLVAAAAYAIGLSDLVGGWWDGLGTAVNGGGSAIGDYWSSSGAMLAFQPAVVLLILGAIVASFGYEQVRTAIRRVQPT